MWYFIGGIIIVILIWSNQYSRKEANRLAKEEFQKRINEREREKQQED